MQGRNACLCLMLLVGCSELPARRERHEPETSLGQAFDLANTGTIAGRVQWDGDLPAAKETVVRASACNPYLYQKPATFTTPHVPQVQPKTGGIANAVVFLRAVDACHSKPWDHAKVRVEFHERRLHVLQGEQRTDVGFVRRGSAIEVVNRDGEYHNLRGRGAAFFAAPLIDANQKHERKLTDSGVVELTCSAGWYWLHAHLMVTEHPYYARTDANGRFKLDRVPAGEYEIVCWLPSWRVLRTELDPETANIARLAWDAPKEQRRSVRVEAGQTSDVSYRWDRTLFGE